MVLVHQISDLINPSGSLKLVLIPLFILVFTVLFAHLANYLLKRIFRKAESSLEKHAEKHKETEYKEKIAADKTKFTFMRRIIVIAIYILGIILMISSIPSLRTISYSLLAGAGVLAVVLGFATQKTFANIISGMMISISQPFRIGDRVKFRDDYGIIEDITLRHTILKTWDNRRVVIPNSIINEEVINNYTFEDEKMLATVELGISYDSDIDLARKIMREEIFNHPAFIRNETDADLLAKADQVKVRVVDCGDFRVTLRGYYWVENQAKAFISSCDLRESIKKRFDKEGVEIPFPYRTLVYKKDLKKAKHFNEKSKRTPKLKKKKRNR